MEERHGDTQREQFIKKDQLNQDQTGTTETPQQGQEFRFLTQGLINSAEYKIQSNTSIVLLQTNTVQKLYTFQSNIFTAQFEGKNSHNTLEKYTCKVKKFF